MTVTLVTAIKGHGITGEQAAHQGCQGCIRRAAQQVDVIGHQCPGKAWRRRIAKDRFHALDKFVAVGTILNYRLAFNSTDDEVVQGAGCIYA